MQLTKALRLVARMLVLSKKVHSFLIRMRRSQMRELLSVRSSLEDAIIVNSQKQQHQLVVGNQCLVRCYQPGWKNQPRVRTYQHVYATDS